ncbi:hypothetical protein BJ508DRAFT_41650 [Ascobolus immersus RN42]|uniref:Autophagy-related protein 13 n=1 Tax=Ascobolus immersus RN42 TaxID=1160509 RepID=A0A3N4IEC1_ASCIM|nr:hypothetical protein BJ508DRAFT_41650 [Ascobolus immersus RN42]
MRQANNGINDQNGRPSTPSRRLSQMAENNRPNSPGVYGNYAQQQEPDTQDNKKSKLNQLLQVRIFQSIRAIVYANGTQNFFLKVAMTVLHTRMTLPPIIISKRDGTGSTARKVNKWFSMELDETEMFSRDLYVWKILNAYDPQQSPPPPLIIETILDANDLSPDQQLVVVSDERRWKVETSEVVIERWKVVLGPSSTGQPFTEDLPVVYKKSIPVIRTVFSYAAHVQLHSKLKKQLSKQVRQKGLKIRCRIRNGDEMTREEYAAVESPLGEGQVRETRSYSLGGVDCAVGFVSVDVTHRENCEFRVESQESLLSSDFMNQDEYFFQPSLGNRNSHRTGQLPYAAGREPSSAPTTAQPRPGASVQQPASGLPVTNLTTGERRIQHMRNAPSMSGSPFDPASSSYRSARESNPSLRSVDNAARRSSVSFSPFKTGSVASSPGAGVAGSRLTSGTSIPNRSRPSTGTGGPIPHRMSMPTPIDSSHSAQASSGSPRPSSMRFSSSFTNRPPRFSGTSINRAEEDGASSGRGSVSSSSNAWAASFPDDSGHSITEDGKKISELMKLLELTEKKGLKSFEQKTTVDPLSRFRKLRDTHAALSESIVEPLHHSQSQPQLHSQEQQRPLSYPSASGLISSLSSSTSPQLFQISPHTPHAPVVRSRLSEGLSAADANGSEGRGALHHRPRPENTTGPGSSVATPLDIPSPPRGGRTVSSFRRPNSFVQNKAVVDVLEDLDDPATAFANAGRQSASLGTVDTVPVSLARMREDHDAASAAADRPNAVGAGVTSNLAATTTSNSSASSSVRGRFPARGRGGWSGQNSGSASGGSGLRPGEPDDDDLLFTMSEDVSDPNHHQRRNNSEDGAGKAAGPSNLGEPKERPALDKTTKKRV